jgi:4-hydroxybenzoyl-CoA reductase subunit beta
MPEFEVHQPRTASEAAQLKLKLPDAMFVAGGTDLLPNLKHQLQRPKHLISLAEVDGFSGVCQDDDGSILVGAGTTLHALAHHPTVLDQVPGLSLAASLVAGPQHRRMGTIGGNVMLDTRCLFYNQSLSWRHALGYCLKAGGDFCHVIGSKKTCVAAHSSDTVPVLTAVDASLRFADGQTVALDGLYSQDGRYENNPSVGRDALLVGIHIPALPKGHRSTYRKVRQRASVDFPQLGIGLAGDFDDGNIVRSLRVVVSAVMPKPKILKRMDEAVGSRLTDDLIESLAEAAFRQVRPQVSLCGDPAWRRHMVRVEMRRGLQELRHS